MSKEMSFEEKLKELERLISEIESGEDGLNKSIEKYVKAQDLADDLAKMLGEVKESINLENEEDYNSEEEE